MIHTSTNLPTYVYVCTYMLFYCTFVWYNVYTYVCTVAKYSTNHNENIRIMHKHAFQMHVHTCVYIPHVIIGHTFTLHMLFFICAHTVCAIVLYYVCSQVHMCSDTVVVYTLYCSTQHTAVVGQLLEVKCIHLHAPFAGTARQWGTEGWDDRGWMVQC